MNRLLAALPALAALAPLGAPALAAESETLFDQRASLEWQSWNWASPSSNASLGYSVPMTVFTVTDHSGAILGAGMAVAANEARRSQAERDAIREGKSSYTYAVEEGHAREGTRLGFSVGYGGIGSSTPSGTGVTATGAGAYSRMARLFLEGDLFEVLGGAVVFNTGTAYWSAISPAAGTGGSALNIEAWNWPVEVRYRYAAPFLPGLVIEPSASFDWLYTAYYAVNGGARWDARNFGVEVGYHLLPSVKLRAGYFLNRLAHNQVSWMKTEEVVDMKSANVGLTLSF